MPAVQLCPELWDDIIDFLHDDHTALRACAMVCRSWVPASRLHLFSHIILSGCGRKANNAPGTVPPCVASCAVTTTCRKVLGALLSAPHLASYIKKLTIYDSRQIRNLMYDPHIHPSALRLVSTDITFPPLLRKLIALEELEFHYPPRCPSEDLRPTWTPVVFKEITNALTELSTLKTLTLRHVGLNTLPEFVQILNLKATRHLRAIQFDCVGICPSPVQNSGIMASGTSSKVNNNLAQEKASLDHLMLRSSSSVTFLPFITCPISSPFDLSSLRSLVINVTPENCMALDDLLVGTPNVDSLEMEFDTFFDFDIQTQLIRLQNLQSLSALCLQISFLIGRLNPIPYLLAFLSGLPLPSDEMATASLSTLAINCTIDKAPPSMTLGAFEVLLESWRVFDAFFSESCQPQLQELKRLRIDFALDSPIGDTTLPQIANYFAKELIGLEKRGMLEIDIYEVR